MKWCIPCFKPSTSEDLFEEEISLAIQVSQCEAEKQEANQLDLAIQESSRIHREQEQEEERRRTKEIEKDAQIANGIQYEEREKQINYKTALEEEEDEQITKAVKKSLKEKGKRKQLEYDQVENDKQHALMVQEMEESPPRFEENNSISTRAPVDEDEQRAIWESLKRNGKTKQSEDVKLPKVNPPRFEETNNISTRAPMYEDEQRAIWESLKRNGKTKQSEDVKLPKVNPPRFEENNNISTRAPMYEDEQRTIWESLKRNGKTKQSIDEVEEDVKLPKVNPPRSMCGSCDSVIEHGRSVNVLGVLWHPECLICHACDKPIAIQEVENYVSNSRGNFHKSCYDRYCYVCKGKIRKYSKHPFWKELYCQSHEADGTPKCCSCERLEPRGTNYVMLGDGRWLCLECMDSAVMDSDECQPLHFDMRDFFEGLQMKIKKPFPFLLVEKQALNKAEKEEKIDYQYEVVTRGICLSEAQTVTSVSQKPIMGPNNKLVGMATESQMVVRECEVTAILILYGLPRLLTGYILAHEMMHAYLRLNGHKNLDNVLEEGICQVLGHMWLESQTYATADALSATSSSSSRTPAANASKKGEWSNFEKELVEFCKNQIETDDSPVYGRGFRTVYEMVTKSGLHETLRFIVGG